MLFNDVLSHFALAPPANSPTESQVGVGLTLGDAYAKGDLDLVVASSGADTFTESIEGYLPAGVKMNGNGYPSNLK